MSNAEIAQLYGRFLNMNNNIYNAEIIRIMSLKLLTSIFIISHREKYKIILQAGNVMIDNVEFINLRLSNILERYGKFKVRLR